MQTVNERLRDESIAHAVWISRYSTGVAARMVKILNDSDAELTARLLVALDSLDPGSFTVTRLESLLASVREVNRAAINSMFTSLSGELNGFAPIFPDICYHLTHYKPAAADIPVASDNPAHYADAIRYNARTPLQGSLLPLTRLVWA
ncbi:hypothetical protein VEE37_24020 [Escherichia coli]|nr:hypothetical protein VEE02_32090 [Escherichia coli]BEB53568.1 hypothetical protein VEE37_24020 [Escherichia coli]